MRKRPASFISQSLTADATSSSGTPGAAETKKKPVRTDKRHNEEVRAQREAIEASLPQAVPDIQSNEGDFESAKSDGTTEESPHTELEEEEVHGQSTPTHTPSASAVEKATPSITPTIRWSNEEEMANADLAQLMIQLEQNERMKKMLEKAISNASQPRSVLDNDDGNESHTSTISADNNSVPIGVSTEVDTEVVTIDDQSHAAAAAPTEVEIQVAQENNQSQAVAATTIETETETEMLVHALTLEPIERRTHYGDTSRCAFSKDEYKKYFPDNWDSEWRNNGTTYEPPEVYLEQYRLFRGGIWNFGDFSANLPKSAFRVYTVPRGDACPQGRWCKICEIWLIHSENENWEQQQLCVRSYRFTQPSGCHPLGTDLELNLWNPLRSRLAAIEASQSLTAEIF